MPFDANGNWVSNSPLYSGGFTQPQGGFNQGLDSNNYGTYMGMPQSSPMSFANTGAAPQSSFPTQPSGTSSTTESSTTSKGGGGGALNPIGAGLGAIQVIGGLYGMHKLNKTPWPEYKNTQATLAAWGRAQQMAKMGYTPNQAAAFKANQGTALNTQYQNNVNMAGGGLAGALGARGTAQRLQSMNQFAAADAEKQMGNIRYADQQTGNLQSMENMKTQAALQRRMMLEQAYGAAIKQGSQNIANSFDTGASFANFAKLASAFG